MTELFGGLTITVPFLVEDLSKEEDLKIVWKEKVEQVFESYTLSCRVDWDEGKMMVEHTKDTKKRGIVRKGGRALCALATGLTTECVEPILNGTIKCDVLSFRKPDDIMESDFTCKYDNFIYKFGDEMKCPERLSCVVHFQESAVISLSKSKYATRLVSHFVKACVLGDVPFDEDYFNLWFRCLNETSD